MAESLSARIRNIEARMNQLKTAGLRSSASITTTVKTVTIPVQIVPYKINYEWDNCASKYSARIHIDWTDNVGLCSAYIKSPTNLENRRYQLDRLTNVDDDCEFGFDIISGSNEDLEAFNDGQTVPPFDVTISVVATADFTISYTLREEH